MTGTDRDELAILWAEHRCLTYPDDLKFADGLEECLLLDPCIAGAVMIALRGSPLDTWRVRALQEGITFLRRSLRRIPKGEGRSYAVRLIRMSSLTLNEHYRVVRE
ncbi:hypothetical protein LO762_23775 [Actinocorallia sp. API 0066]|uniref:hypothetical protein n=1 Tax=Actinocorallia sp. API 0066 TaxID=2896846 RepID=UPI001E471FEF|nr:hypothetical protein [Actinocorallia sp. API 0066]MCD0452188.1 hypothetical protein [Actinocorallia sp. API 0066]